MLVHSVIFWAKSDLTHEQRATFRVGLETLRKIPSITAIYIGAPAAVTPRPVVDRSYTYGLTIVFKDVAAHNAYQVHPIHQTFVSECKQYWEKVQIYDTE
jgi:hypothetical protein